MSDDNLNFTFKFDDGSKIVLKGKEILKISSSFYYEHINRNSNIEIEIPSKISCDTFKEYIEITDFSPKQFKISSQYEVKITFRANKNLNIAKK